MKIATFNANSIRARMPIILDWLEGVGPDILCVQETKVQDKDFPVSSFEDAGYSTIFRGQKSYNGVAVLSRHSIDNVRGDLYGEGDDQARFLSCVIQGIPVINVYVPQGFAPETDKFEYKLKWFKELHSHISSNYDPGSPLIVTGDFNVALEPIDLYDPDGMKGGAGYHPNEQALMRSIMEWGLVDLFRQEHSEGDLYTFWDYRIPNGFKRNMGWRIDYILATQPLAGKLSSIWVDKEPRSLPRPSDHTFLVAEFI